MASIIRIKRSSGTNKPTTLNWGELGYVTGIGSYGGVNQYKDRIFVGDDGQNVNPIGGFYYASMMEHSPGALTGVTNARNTDGGIVAVLDSNRKIDEWNVDNLTLNSNTLSSTDTDGDIIFNPNGSGEVMIPDDTFLGFGGGANGTDAADSKIEYDEDGTNQLTFTGADVRINITTDSTTKDTGALIVEGGVGIEKSLNVGGQLNVTGFGQFDQIRLQDNVVSTTSGDTIYIDPYPDGLSNEGTCVIKGNLQVDGTTTAVNSTAVTVNDPLFVIGDVTSKRTVMATVSAGANTITLDSVVGINTGDTISGSTSLAGNPGLSTVTNYNTGTKVVTIDQVTTAGITTTTQLTITHAYDTNTDRGIQFKYNTSTGTSNNKDGFFGYIDADSNTASNAPARSWTYVPDATIANSTVTGTRGYLDIKGIYYQTADYNTHGAVYFDANGLQTSTNNPATPTITSKQVLTAITKVTLALPSSKTVVTGDIIKQDTTNAYGVVETGGTLASINLVGVEGTFTNTYNIRKEGTNGGIENLSVIPSSATVIYTNRPTWTSTLDGGTF